MKYNSKTHKTILDPDFNLEEEDFQFKYQDKLTVKLDSISDNFDQNTFNEIVLWKVNRYAEFDNQTIVLINEIDKSETIINVEKTTEILKRLLKTKGVQLAMASTILRFKNPKIYQIIDLRVYRIIYENQELKLSNSATDKNLKSQIELYLNYLKDLREVCDKLKIPFSQSDRILFMADKRINKEHTLKNY